jgi:hypothetical protein
MGFLFLYFLLFYIWVKGIDKKKWLDPIEFMSRVAGLMS